MSAAVTPFAVLLVAELCRRAHRTRTTEGEEYADKRQPAHACAFAGMP
jgi:hypothetical protein